MGEDDDDLRDLLGPEPESADGDDDDLRDLLGPEPEPEPAPRKRGRPPKPKPEPAPPPRKRGRPPKPKPEPEPEVNTRKAGGRTDAQVVQRLYQPCSISFIAEVTGRDRKVVTRLLAGVTPLSYHRGNVPLYDFRQALDAVIQPKVDPKMIEERLKKLSANDLPPALQKDVWDARLKAQKWMQQAGELWATEDVLEVLSEAFQRLKTTTQLWIDQVGDNNDLPEKARAELTELVDALQADLHRGLVEMPKERATAAQTASLENEDG